MHDFSHPLTLDTFSNNIAPSDRTSVVTLHNFHVDVDVTHGRLFGRKSKGTQGGVKTVLLSFSDTVSSDPL